MHKQGTPPTPTEQNPKKGEKWQEIGKGKEKSRSGEQEKEETRNKWQDNLIEEMLESQEEQERETKDEEIKKLKQENEKLKKESAKWKEEEIEKSIKQNASGSVLNQEIEKLRKENANLAEKLQKQERINNSESNREIFVSFFFSPCFTETKKKGNANTLGGCGEQSCWRELFHFLSI